MPDFITCDNKNITPEELLSALLTKTADGDWALRTMKVVACAEDAIDCDSKVPMTAYEKLLKTIGVNSCGKAAIRLAIDE